MYRPTGASAWLASLSGVSLAVGDPEQREQAGRLLDLLMDGLRYGAAPRHALQDEHCNG